METLQEARTWLRERVDEGARCPCCNQFAKVYRRKLNSGIARALILMYRHSGTDWLYKPAVLRGVGAAARDESIARYWGLVEEETEPRPDGGRAGWWRVTQAGAEYVTGKRSVPKYAHIYDGRLLRTSGPMVTIRDALGSSFDLAELLGLP